MKIKRPVHPIGQTTLYVQLPAVNPSKISEGVFPDAILDSRDCF